MTPSKDGENRYYEEKKDYYISRKAFRYNKKQNKGFKLYKKVKDHCHFTWKFRGVAHSACNLHYKVPPEIPVKIHNGYQ